MRAMFRSAVVGPGTPLSVRVRSAGEVASPSRTWGCGRLMSKQRDPRASPM
jgi:hypothetical protein